LGFGGHKGKFLSVKLPNLDLRDGSGSQINIKLGNPANVGK